MKRGAARGGGLEAAYNTIQHGTIQHGGGGPRSPPPRWALGRGRGAGAALLAGYSWGRLSFGEVRVGGVGGGGVGMAEIRRMEFGWLSRRHKNAHTQEPRAREREERRRRRQWGDGATPPSPPLPLFSLEWRRRLWRMGGVHGGMLMRRMGGDWHAAREGGEYRYRDGPCACGHSSPSRDGIDARHRQQASWIDS